MRLMAATDIALRVLMMLARDPAGPPVSVEVLADELGGLSRHHLHKIVQALTMLGATRTVRGSAGGVALAADPAKLRLGSLARQLEDRQPLVECFNAETCSCTLVGVCKLRGMLRDAKERFYVALDEHSLAEIVPPRKRHRAAPSPRVATP